MNEMKMDAVEIRRIRIAKTLDMVKRMGEVDYEKAMNVISYNLGVSAAKTREYLGILKGAGQVKIEQGTIFPVKARGGKSE